VRRDLEARLERLEDALAPKQALRVVSIYEGETEAEAMAIYKAGGGIIGPKDLVICRTVYTTRDKAARCA
jgi:hypothetical protein